MHRLSEVCRQVDLLLPAVTAGVSGDFMFPFRISEIAHRCCATLIAEGVDVLAKASGLSAADICEIAGETGDEAAAWVANQLMSCVPAAVLLDGPFQDVVRDAFLHHVEERICTQFALLNNALAARARERLNLTTRDLVHDLRRNRLPFTNPRLIHLLASTLAHYIPELQPHAAHIAHRALVQSAQYTARLVRLRFNPMEFGTIRQLPSSFIGEASFVRLKHVFLSLSQDKL